MNLCAVLSKFQFILKKFFYYIFIVSDLIRRFTTLISLQTPGISAPVNCGTSRQVRSKVWHIKNGRCWQTFTDNKSDINSICVSMIIADFELKGIKLTVHLFKKIKIKNITGQV